tara:strand:+ start:465 stop:962 length:498 start_codon:yes stop_codon:yes gene_type:complete
MTKYIIIKKNGDLEQKKTRNNIDSEQIYKLCNYKNEKEFKKLHSFTIDKNEKNNPDNCYEIYGKSDGRANSENKYEFPPPIDKNLYFGSLCILKKENDSFTDLTNEEWEKKYEELFGGFEYIENSDEEERSVDSEIYSSDEYTKQGYHKDSFIIDDDELVEEDYE